MGADASVAVLSGTVCILLPLEPEAVLSLDCWDTAVWLLVDQQEQQVAFWLEKQKNLIKTQGKSESQHCLLLHSNELLSGLPNNHLNEYSVLFFGVGWL